MKRSFRLDFQTAETARLRHAKKRLTACFLFGGKFGENSTSAAMAGSMAAAGAAPLYSRETLDLHR
jgi:hypothetical protein